MALYTITSDKFADNPDTWGRELNESIEYEIYLMQVYLLGIDSEDFIPEGEQDFAGIPRMQNLSQEERKKRIKETTINNTFLSVFRSLGVYLDKLFAFYYFAKRTQETPISGNGIDNLDSYFANLIQEEYKEFAMKRKIDFPSKMEVLSTLNPRSRERLVAYNKIRIAFEHHGGMAKSDITFPISTIEKLTDKKGLQEVTIRLDIVESKTFQKDQLIKLKPYEVSLISFDIRGWIIKDLLLAFMDLNKKPSI